MTYTALKQKKEKQLDLIKVMEAVSTSKDHDYGYVSNKKMNSLLSEIQSIEKTLKKHDFYNKQEIVNKKDFTNL